MLVARVADAGSAGKFVKDDLWVREKESTLGWRDIPPSVRGPRWARNESPPPSAPPDSSLDTCTVMKAARCSFLIISCSFARACFSLPTRAGLALMAVVALSPLLLPPVAVLPAAVDAAGLLVSGRPSERRLSSMGGRIGL
ncbi:hypothetical protein N2W54_004729 [Lotmaria passim]